MRGYRILRLSRNSDSSWLADFDTDGAAVSGCDQQVCGSDIQRPTIPARVLYF